MEDKTQHVAHFLDLIRKSRRGKCKIYIGMCAGVGKTYRMLQEAQALLKNGIDVKIGYVETHGRAETEAQLRGLPIIPCRRLFYKGKALEEMDVAAIIRTRPEVVIVDELAHTNIEGSHNEKRWQDVVEILDAGINVITAVNIQHIESLHDDVLRITGVDVRERVPDQMISMADETVNLDLTADDLITRLQEGKIYGADKIPAALQHFFRREHILQLRELALKQVASLVERKVELEIPPETALRHERFLACISSNAQAAKTVIRKTARIANYYSSPWYLLYVEVPREDSNRIALDKQRFLIHNFKLATELGGEVIRVRHTHVARAITEEARKRNITTVCIGRPRMDLARQITGPHLIHPLIRQLAAASIDLLILS
ncbi:MAG: sensor protein KdpD [Bacteroidia bacterium]|nr:sensor protein KdpD [Bacteroidia bacterium]